MSVQTTDHIEKQTIPRILIIGGGYVGLYTAYRLTKKLSRGDAQVTVVDPRSYMTYQPFLPEVGSGAISPRHVVAPLRKVLPKAEVLNGRVTKVDQERKLALFEPLVGEPFHVEFSHLVIAVGSVPRTLPIPGLAENGIGFKQVEEAISLRNHVVAHLDLAASTDDVEVRRKALTFVFVGGGFAGVEAIAELEDMARYALRYYPALKHSDMRWVLVEGSNRILPEVGEELGQYTLEALRDRGFDVRLGTFLNSCVDKHVVLSNGEEFDASTIVWTAGVKPNAVLAEYGIPLGEKGHVKGTAELRVEGFANVWVAGDCAQIPDLARPGHFCPPNAQHAVRQAKVLADNIAAAVRGFGAKPYKHKNLGAVASLGLHKGVAQALGFKMKGWPAWLFHRTYHVSRVPTLNRKLRIVAEWTFALFFSREVVSLGSIEAPRAEFSSVAVPAKPGGKDGVTQSANASADV